MGGLSLGSPGSNRLMSLAGLPPTCCTDCTETERGACSSQPGRAWSAAAAALRVLSVLPSMVAGSFTHCLVPSKACWVLRRPSAHQSRGAAVAARWHGCCRWVRHPPSLDFCLANSLTSVFGSTSFVTTAPPATVAPSPTVTPGRMRHPPAGQRAGQGRARGWWACAVSLTFAHRSHRSVAARLLRSNTAWRHAQQTGGRPKGTTAHGGDSKLLTS